MDILVNPAVLVPFGFVGLAILSVVVGSRLGKKFGLSAMKACALISLICCYGFCACVVFGLLVGIFHMRFWLAVIIAVPLGLPVMYLLGKSA